MMGTRGDRKIVRPRKRSLSSRVQFKSHKTRRCLGFVLRAVSTRRICARNFPIVAVVDEAIDPGPELRIHRIGKFLLPPEMKRQIGIQMRKDDARQQICARSFEQKRKLLGADLFAACATDVTMRADPRFHAILGRVAIGANDDRAASVILRDLRDELRIFLSDPGASLINREIDERRASQRASFCAQSFFSS